MPLCHHTQEHNLYTKQYISTQISTAGIPARLRALRGEESQQSFSERIGITRSALANYETGRTTPKPSVLRNICQKLGISESVLKTGEVSAFDDLAGAVGTYREVGTLPGLTDDEKAIVRVLRLCDASVVHSVVVAIIEGPEAKKFDRSLADPLTAHVDVARLYQISKADGFYDRGITPDTLLALMDTLAKKQDPNKNPQ